MSERGRAPRRWHRLDNTANLFPVITSRRFSNVYRLSLNLDQPVVPELLQRALETTLPWFNAFRVRMRRGLFWRYLEENPAVPAIQEEDDSPCRQIDPAQNNQFLFRVTYYTNRINLEVFHALTDGTGALRFLQALCCQYLLLAHPGSFTAEQRTRRWFAEHAADTEDSYVANYTPTKKASFRMGRGYKIKGERRLMDNMGVIHAHIALPGLLSLCREKHVSITHYLTACVAWGLYTQQMGSKPPRHPVNIFTPVNLRKLFDSNTSLNFFSNIYITLNFAEPEVTFDGILAEVKRQFEEKVSREGMLEKISYTVGSGYSTFVRVAPLPLKNAVLRLIFEASAKTSTMGMTNVGAVTMPPPFAGFVTGALVLLSTSPREPLKVSVISLNDTLTVSFTSSLCSTALQRAVIRRMAADGLDIMIESNVNDYLEEPL